LDGEQMNGGVIIATRPAWKRVEVMKRVRSRTSANVRAVDRNAFQALFSSLAPLRGFFEQPIAAGLKGSGDRMASAS
jgi:hypothetical protein